MIGDLESRAIGSGARMNDGKEPYDLLILSWMCPLFVNSYLRDVCFSLGQYQLTGSREYLEEALESIVWYEGSLHNTVGVLSHGAAKYAHFNWASGMKLSILVACIGRHLQSMADGEHIDPESCLPHSAHVCCNICFLHTTSLLYPELNDLPYTYVDGLRERYLERKEGQANSETPESSGNRLEGGEVQSEISAPLRKNRPVLAEDSTRTADAIGKLR